MSQVEFEEFNIPSRYDNEDNTPKIVGWVIKYSGGLIKDEKQAYYVLLGFVMVAIIISIILLTGDDGNSAEGLLIPPAII